MGSELLSPPVSSILLFGLDFLLIFFSALFLSALINPKIFIPWLLGIYLLVYANIVLTVEIGGILSTLNKVSFFLVFHALVFLVLISIWIHKSKPSLFSPIHQARLNLTPFLASLEQHWEIWAFALLCFITFLFFGYLNLVFPQRIDDVLTAYLARVGYWLQHGNLSPWAVDTYQMAQIIYPLNAQAQIYWSLLFLHTDQLAGFSQWFSLPILMLGVYGLSRLLGLDRRWSLVSALISFSFQSIQLQSLNALTDLVSAALFISMVYLFFFGLRTKDMGILVLSGLAFGLSLGTKQTIIFTIPGLILVLLYILFIQEKNIFKYLVYWAVASIGAFILVGAYIYISNFILWGSPLGPPSTYQGFTQNDSAFRATFLVSRFFENTMKVLRVIFEFKLYKFDFTGNIWPGPILLPLLFFSVSYILRLIYTKRENWVAFSLFIIALSETIVLLIIRDFSGALSRYLIIPIVLIIPLGVAGMVRIKRKTFKDSQLE